MHINDLLICIKPTIYNKASLSCFRAEMSINQVNQLDRSNTNQMQLDHNGSIQSHQSLNKIRKIYSV